MDGATMTAADPGANNATAGNPGSGGATGAVQSGTQSQPDQREARIAQLESELGTLRGRVANGQTFYSRANKYGLDKPEDLDRWGPVFQTLSQKKIDPTHFLRAFESEPESTPQSLTAEKLQEILDKREQEQALKSAQREYESMTDSELQALSREKLAPMFKDAPKGFDQLMADAAYARYLSMRTPYEQGHPLHGRAFKPLGQDGMASLVKTLTDSYAEYVKGFKAQHLADVGDAASTQTNGTVAGLNTGGGAPAKQERGEPTKEESIALLQSLRAKRGR